MVKTMIKYSYGYYKSKVYMEKNQYHQRAVTLGPQSGYFTHFEMRPCKMGENLSVMQVEVFCFFFLINSS